MNTLVISDVHLSKRNAVYFSSVLFPFLSEVKNSYHISHIIFLGDIFTSSIVDNHSLKLFKELINIFKDNDISIIAGNHDFISKVETIYDLFLLNDNIKIIKSIEIIGNNIFVPYIFNLSDCKDSFLSIKSYIDKSDYSEYFIYSHNDFAEIYKFRSSFINISDIFDNTDKKVNLINGHNHVNFFKSNNNLNILNLGCAINTSFNDTTLLNNFLLINNDGDIKVLRNKYSIQYHTFHIKSDEDIERECEKLNVNNYSHVKFIIYKPSIIIDNKFKDFLYENYSIADIHVEYELDSLIDLSKRYDVDSTLSIDNICEKLEIDINEFSNDSNNEKLEVLLILLNLMFENRKTSKEDMNNVINIVMKYIK